MKRVLFAALPAVLLMGLAGPADARHGSDLTARIEIRGYVPVICRADFISAPVPISGNQVQLGEIHEFCNSGSGYQVVAEYTPTADPGMLMVDGQLVRLDRSGRTIIQRVGGPSMQTSRLDYLPGSQPIFNLHISLNGALI